MAKKPEQAAPTPLTDPGQAQEIFATDVAGVGIIGGCVNVNLAVHRWMPDEPGTQPSISRALVARLMLSREAAGQLAQALTKLSTSIQSAQKAEAEAREKPVAK